MGATSTTMNKSFRTLYARPVLKIQPVTTVLMRLYASMVCVVNARVIATVGKAPAVIRRLAFVEPAFATAHPVKQVLHAIPLTSVARLERGHLPVWGILSVQVQGWYATGKLGSVTWQMGLAILRQRVRKLSV